MDSSVIRSYELFQHLDDDQFASILDHCEMIELAFNEVLFADGDPATDFFILHEGKAVIQIEPTPGHVVDVYIVKPSMILGWSALVPPHFYTGACKATEACRLWRIPGPELLRICEADPRLGFRVMSLIAKTVSKRLFETRKELGNLVYWVRH